MKKNIAWIVSCVIVIIIGICACLFWVAYPLKYKYAIVKYSQEYNLQPQLVAAVICVESRYKASATSGAGACGLMQIMPSTYNWVKQQINIDDNIYDVNNNIRSGCYYLRYLLDKYKNVVYVLACYNAGEGVVANWGDSANFNINQIEYPETLNYVSKVLSLQKLYASRFC